jgi:acyl-homoserine lactone acylase PvdQ
MRRYAVRSLGFVLLYLAALGSSYLLATEQMAKSVTIYRDQWGVPHVHGPTDASCVFGYAYAQAEDNFWQIEDTYIRSLGRASEVYGEKALDDDRIVRALELSRLAQQEYASLTPQMKSLVDAYAAGINWFLAKNPQVKPRLLTKFEPWWQLAFRRYSIYVAFLYGQTGLRRDGIREVSPMATGASTQGSNM